MRLVLATRNEHKLRELAQLMRPIELDPLPGDVTLPPETGTTFADNALGKARAAAAATGRTAIADDSGIEAAALSGAPGVWSARFAGEHATDEENLTKLLRDVPPDGDTRVAYVCAIACVEPGGREHVVHGRCEGRLTHEPRGTGGFGYDPAFVPDDHPGDLTMAQLTPEEKDAISHRGRAARELRRRLLEAEEAARPRSPLAELLRRGDSHLRRVGRSGRGAR
jgi:XTP/dITP diphosphohydrolase